jgi:hypothetical protein
VLNPIRVTILAAAAGLAAGCGGDGDSTVALTHAQLVERANAICAELARGNAALELPFRPYTVESEGFFAGMLENVAAARESFEELAPPAGDRESHERLVAGYADAELKLERVQAAVSVDQDEEAVTLFDELAPDVKQIATAERELGVCPGETSARRTISAAIRRTRPNPLGETGELGG